MKLIRFLAAAVLFLSLQISDASQGLVAYINSPFLPGNNIFVNPFEAGNGDTLSVLFGSVTVPDGTTVSLWNSTTRMFDTTSTFNSGSWSANLTILPGTGAELNTPTSFTNTFIGTVLNHDGSTFNDSGNPTPPPVYSGPNGVFLLGDKFPTVDTGTDIFLNILGRAPNPGEQIITFDSASQNYITSTYLGNGNWNGGSPTLDVGQAALLNVGPVPFDITSVPEPNTLALAGLAGMGMLMVMRRKQP